MQGSKSVIEMAAKKVREVLIFCIMMQYRALNVSLQQIWAGCMSGNIYLLSCHALTSAFRRYPIAN